MGEFRFSVFGCRFSVSGYPFSVLVLGFGWRFRLAVSVGGSGWRFRLAVPVGGSGWRFATLTGRDRGAELKIENPKQEPNQQPRTRTDNQNR
jgi:hypothetical protein